MKILALSYPEVGVTPESMGAHLADEADTAWKLYLAGFVREAYLCTDPAGPSAALILEADSALDAHAMLDDFPLRAAGLVNFHVTELGPFLPWTALLGADTTAHAV